MNILSRKNEFEADEYAKKHTMVKVYHWLLKNFQLIALQTYIHIHFMFLFVLPIHHY